MEQTPTSPLLSEIRALVAGSHQPIIMVAVPRWAALHLSRERAQELDTKLTEAYAESLRFDPRKRNNNGSCVLWLPVDGHPHNGCIILANIGYEAGVLIAWHRQRPLLWPRTFREGPRPLLAWRSDQHVWVNNVLVSEPETNRLTREAHGVTHRTPLFVHPSPYLVEVIAAAAQTAAEEEPQPVAPAHYSD